MFLISIHSHFKSKLVYFSLQIKSGILREEDRKNVIRNVREQVGTQMKRLQGHFPPLLEGVVGNNREQLEVKVQQAADSSLAPPSDVTPISTDSEGIRHPVSTILILIYCNQDTLGFIERGISFLSN